MAGIARCYFGWLTWMLLLLPSTHTHCTESMELCRNTCHCKRIKRHGLQVQCWHKHLTTVPKKIPANTTSLQVDQNEIEQVRRDDFNHCSSLLDLNLQENKIKIIEKGAFDGLKYLEVLNLDRNHLDFSDYESVPLRIFHSMTRLIQLTIQSNILSNKSTYRADLFAPLSKLKVLSFDAINGIPLALKNVKQLKVLKMYGDVQTLYNNTFESLAKVRLKELSLSGRKLKLIEDEAFLPLSRLSRLDISGNTNLTFSSERAPGWKSLPKSLTYLIARRIVENFNSLEPWPTQFFFSGLIHTTLSRLSLDENGIWSFPYLLNDTFPHLKILSLKYNRLADFNGLHLNAASFPTIKTIDLDQQARYSLTPSRFMARNKKLEFTLPSDLTNIACSYALSGAYGWWLKTIVIHNMAPQMNYINLAGNRVYKLHVDLQFHPILNRSVDVFNLTDSHMSRINVSVSLGHLTINTLDLSKNVLGEHIHMDTEGLFMVQMRDMKVKILNLTFNHIRFLHSNFLKNGNFLECLILKDNSINNWEPEMLHLQHLRHLDLSSNLLPDLMHKMGEFDAMFRKSGHFELDISNNPFQVQCLFEPFLLWLIHTEIKILNKKEYFFYNGSHYCTFKNLQSCISVLDIACQSAAWMMWTSITTSLFIASLLLAYVIFRMRWDIRYFCLKLVRGRKLYQSIVTDQACLYDAFVAYHQEDLNWVVHMLMPQLENNPPYFTLCVHHRDWLPGPTIEENISESIENSRKTLIVLTKNFIRSQWCEFEVRMARCRGFDEGQEIVVVVALEDIPLSDMTRTLSNLRRHNTWLDWPARGQQSAEEEENFWVRLRQALRYPTDRPPRCECGRVAYPDGIVHVN